MISFSGKRKRKRKANRYSGKKENKNVFGELSETGRNPNKSRQCNTFALGTLYSVYRFGALTPGIL